ncbi:hypothetical protein SSIG_07987 [Streptomyces filamentosus NRRL 11379]|nr:hypothetical protein SSIG_07987 [Streptomyces filamentosus NRRL 11379]
MPSGFRRAGAAGIRRHARRRISRSVEGGVRPGTTGPVEGVSERREASGGRPEKGRPDVSGETYGRP